jgi:hypothetical protein
MLLTIHYLPVAARVADHGGLTGGISAIMSRGLFHESDAKSQSKAYFMKYPHYRGLRLHSATSAPVTRPEFVKSHQESIVGEFAESGRDRLNLRCRL